MATAPLSSHGIAQPLTIARVEAQSGIDHAETHTQRRSSRAFKDRLRQAGHTYGYRTIYAMPLKM